MSDSHDNWANLEKAVIKANEAECMYLLFAGDLISPPGINTLKEFKGEVKIIWGNNEGEKLGFANKIAATENIELCGDICEITIDNTKIFMNHYPRISELAAKSGEFDLCIYGHTHENKEEKINNVLLVNPGTLSVNNNATFYIFDTITNTLKLIEC